MDDRRTQPRVGATLPVRVGATPESSLPTAMLIDLSLAGILVAFEEPVALDIGQAVVITLGDAQEQLHLQAITIRSTRGLDFRTYTAFSFAPLDDEDTDRLGELLHDWGS